MMDLLDKWLPVMSPDEGAGGSGGGESSGGSGGGGETSGDSTAGGAVSSGENFDIPLGDDLDSVTMPDAKPSGQSGPTATGGPGAAAGQQQAAPVAQPVAPAAQVQQQQPQQVEDDSDEGESSPESVIAQLTESAEAYAEHFGNELFGLSPEEVEALQINPEIVLPRLMGRVLVQAMRSIPHQIMRYVPGIIEGHVAQARESNRAESEFLAAWPGLGNHRDVAEKAIRATVAAYGPGVLSRPDLIRYSGMLAFQMLGHQAPPVGGAAAQGGGVRGGQPRNGAAPFVPAGSAASASGGPSGSDDPWAGFTLPE